MFASMTSGIKVGIGESSRMVRSLCLHSGRDEHQHRGRNGARARALWPPVSNRCKVDLQFVLAVEVAVERANSELPAKLAH